MKDSSGISSAPVEGKSQGPVFLIAGILMILIIGYGVFIAVAYVNSWWIFGQYKPPPLKNGFQPGGELIQLTPSEQVRRRSCLTGGDC